MKIWAIARITFAGFFRNKVLYLFIAIFLCALLSSLTDLLSLRSAARHESPNEVSAVLNMVGGILWLISGFGSLLAAWAAADAVGGEMKSGTVLAVMARPVRRWEYLLGKYAGAELLMATYVLFMFGFIYLLTWIGGQRVQTTPWVFIVYPLCRYAIYGAIGIFFVTFMHQLAALVGVVVISILAFLVKPGDNTLAFLPGAVRNAAYVLLPSTNLLSEDRFLAITKTSLSKITWEMHAVALAHGLDYALIFFLLAVWSFQHRSLSRD